MFFKHKNREEDKVRIGKLLKEYIDSNYKPEESIPCSPKPGKAKARVFCEGSAMCDAMPQAMPLDSAEVHEEILAEPKIYASKAFGSVGAFEDLDQKLAERIAHRSDTFSEYLLFLIKQKGMENAEVHKRALLDKKLFSKIKNNPEYHPQKDTALRLCVGAKLSLDETKDLLGRAGYALSPSELRDIIYSFFIENEHYDMIDIDIQLEEYGLPCIIS